MVLISIITEVYEVHHQQLQVNSGGKKTRAFSHKHRKLAWPFKQLAKNQIYRSANECISRSKRRNNAFIAAKI